MAPSGNPSAREQQTTKQIIMISVVAAGLFALTVFLWPAIRGVFWQVPDDLPWYLGRYTLAAIVAAVFIVIGVLVYFVAEKTIWELLELLIVPIVLAVVGFGFTIQQDARQEAIADQREQYTAMEAYIDSISELLVKDPGEDYGLRDSPQGGTLRDIARSRTMVVLLRLGDGNKRPIVRFLYESELIKTEDASNENANDASKERDDILPCEEDAIVCLVGADLAGVELQRSFLREVDLQGANLEGADLTGANLVDADLSGITLSDAKLGIDNRTQKVTRLKGADMSRADLRGAVGLDKAKGLTQEQLQQAYGDEKIEIPKHLKRPNSWSKSIKEQKKNKEPIDATPEDN